MAEQKRIVQIEKTPLDEKFRSICRRMIISAKEGIYIIAGELGSMLFYDMSFPVQDAIVRRGVPVSMYATNRTPPYLRNYAVSIGAILYIGNRGIDRHYLLVDGKNFVVSQKPDNVSATKVGQRYGEAHYHDPEGFRDGLRLFKELLQEGHPVSSVNPLIEPSPMRYRPRKLG